MKLFSVEVIDEPNGKVNTQKVIDTSRDSEIKASRRHRG